MKTLKELTIIKKESTNMANCKSWALINEKNRNDIAFLQDQKKEYEQVITDEEMLQNNSDYNKIISQIYKLEQKDKKEKDAKEKDALKKRKAARDDDMSADEMWATSRWLLNPQFRLITEPQQPTYLGEIADIDNKIIKKIKDPKVYNDVLDRYIANRCVVQDVKLSPKKIQDLRNWFRLYGERITKYEIYGGLGEDVWCYSRCKHLPEPGPCPTWMHFLARMSDPEAFAAWVYGVISNQYKGRQILWWHGENGSDGKSTVQKLICEQAFPDVYFNVSNDMFNDGARFTTNSFVDMKLAAYDDCNNSMLLFKEIVKQISSGEDSAKVKTEGKGDNAQSAQLITRLMVNSNYPPSVSEEVFSRSRLLYVYFDKMQEKGDRSILIKFAEEFPQFLHYAKQCYELRCPDNYQIKQNQKTEEMIDQLTMTFGENHRNIFDKYFVKIEHSDAEETFIKTSDINDKLVQEGLRDNHKQGDWYRWLKKEHGLERKAMYRDKQSRMMVVRGMCLKDKQLPVLVPNMLKVVK